MGYGEEREDSTVCQEIIQTVVMDIVKQQQQQQKEKENESLKTYKKKPRVYIQQTEEEINSSMDDFVAVVEKEEARAKKKVVQPLLIERNVVNKRDATKKQQEEWEYDTPEDLKPKKNQPARRNMSKNHNIVIDKVQCTKPTWTTLEKDVAMHYESWFKTTQDENKE